MGVWQWKVTQNDGETSWGTSVWGFPWTMFHDLSLAPWALTSCNPATLPTFYTYKGAVGWRILGISGQDEGPQNLVSCWSLKASQTPPPSLVAIEAILAVLLWTRTLSWAVLSSLCKQLRHKGQSRSRPWGSLKNLRIRVSPGLQGWYCSPGRGLWGVVCC